VGSINFYYPNSSHYFFYFSIR